MKTNINPNHEQSKSQKEQTNNEDFLHEYNERISP